MNDREFLKLAANAIGCRLLWLNVEVDKVVIKSTPILDDGSIRTNHWNPLINDGDALRLAVKLNLSVDQICQINEVDTARAELPNTNVSCLEFYDDTEDQYAATRRAIVRAAAIIGKEFVKKDEGTK